MKLRVGNRHFDWWTMGLGSIEHRTGVVALVARPGDDAGETKLLDATVADDMCEVAKRWAEDGRLRRDEPGPVVGLITLAAERREAVGIVHALLRRGWLYAEPVFDDLFV